LPVFQISADMKKLFLSLAAVLMIAAACTPSAEKYLARGREKYAHRDYTGAITDLTSALEKNSGLAEAWYCRGLAKWSLNEGVPTSPNAGKALQTSILKDTVNLVLGAEMVVLSATPGKPFSDTLHVFSADAGAGGDIKASALICSDEIADYTKAIELNPGYADAWYSRAMAWLRSGQSGRACQDFKKAGELGRADAFEQIPLYCR
jgi:tetratricopeptide (TPR) repeat protein